jgi:hypothetical protein
LLLSSSISRFELVAEDDDNEEENTDEADGDAD